jgi:hypothetical protein
VPALFCASLGGKVLIIIIKIIFIIILTSPDVFRKKSLLMNGPKELVFGPGMPSVTFASKARAYPEWSTWTHIMRPISKLVWKKFLNKFLTKYLLVFDATKFKRLVC